MNFRKNRKNVALLNVTPLIDVVFILLVFFMLTTNFARFRLIGVETPEETEVVKESDAAIVILIKGNGDLEYDNKPATLEEVAKKVAEITEIDPGRGFLIRPEAGVEMQMALDVFQLTRQSGGYAVSFSRPLSEDAS